MSENEEQVLTAKAGDVWLSLSETTGWEVGDRIAIASTEFDMDEAQNGRRREALEALLAYYRSKYPLPEATRATDDFTAADRVVDHVLEWGPYEPADYGPEIDWEWDPRDDIEWVAQMYRFRWARALAAACLTSGVPSSREETISSSAGSPVQPARQARA